MTKEINLEEYRERKRLEAKKADETKVVHTILKNISHLTKGPSHDN